MNYSKDISGNEFQDTLNTSCKSKLGTIENRKMHDYSSQYR